ncbi:PqqD family peptide modification chaperone [Streptomyces sp. NPDC093109]|uniref:PqqD family peptide modification chaperone n=1 Tax=Streptomyces sp. NPDC093109 TaxID=3154977 RepID=UPI00344DB77C
MRHAQLDIDLRDTATLAPGVRCSDGSLHDGLTDSAVKVNPTASKLIGWLDGHRTLREVSELGAAQWSVPEDSIAEDLVELVITLDRNGLLTIHRAWQPRVHPIAMAGWIGRWLTLDWPLPPSRRVEPRLSKILVAQLLASRWLLLWGGLISAFMVALIATSGASEVRGTSVYLYAAGPPLLLVSALLTVAFHEYGHTVAMRTGSDAPPCFVIVRGSRIAVAHRPMEPAAEKRVAFCGPVAGLLLLGMLTAICLALLPSAVVWPMTALVGAAHAWSLLPWSADGRILWSRSSSGRRTAHATEWEGRA